MNTKTLTAAKLLAAIEAADKVTRGFVDEFISAGRGHETMSAIRDASVKGFDPLAQAYCNAIDTENVLRAEKTDRMTYHGKLSPIRCAA